MYKYDKQIYEKYCIVNLHHTIGYIYLVATAICMHA